jgi:excisionase family DNA binding protein
MAEKPNSNQHGRAEQAVPVYIKTLQNDLRHQNDAMILRFENVESLLEQVLTHLLTLPETITVPIETAPSSSPDDYLRTKEAVAFLGIAESTFNKYLYEGKITAYKFGAKLNKFKRSDLIEFQRNYLRKAN